MKACLNTVTRTDAARIALLLTRRLGSLGALLIRALLVLVLVGARKPSMLRDARHLECPAHAALDTFEFLPSPRAVHGLNAALQSALLETLRLVATSAIERSIAGDAEFPAAFVRVGIGDVIARTKGRPGAHAVLRLSAPLRRALDGS